MENNTDEKEGLVTGGGELVRKLVSQGKLYDKEFERWLTECKRITRRYRAERSNGVEFEEDTAAWFNIFWASLQTALPSLYARTPVPQVDRRYKDADPVARVASEILERAARFELGNFDFDSQIKASILDRLLYARGIARVYYEPKIELVNGVEQKVSEAVRIGYIQLQDYKHSAARTWEEVNQMRFRSYLSREEAAARFGKEKAAMLKYTHVPEAMEDNRAFGDGEQADFKKAEVWEVWDKPTRSVIWICNEVKNDVLDIVPDPLNLEGFFPMPRPLYGSLTNDSLVPVPDARQCKKLYNLLDDIEAKIGALTQDLRVAGVYDAQLEEIPKIASGGDRLVPVRNYAALKAQGGINAAIEWWPLDQIVNALGILYQQKEQTKNDIYEITGWADIMRGSTDPNETAAAQQLKGKFASIRLTDAQNDVQRFCRDLIALMGEIIAEQFEPQNLAAMTGMEFVPGETPEEKQQNYLAAVELLRSEPMRRFRIDIETDSTLAINEAVDQQSRVEFMQSLVGALQTMGPLFEQMPAFVPVLGEAMTFVARTYRAGRAFEGSIEQAIEQTKQMLAAQQDAPTPPDPKMAELQAKMELERFKAEEELRLTQVKAEQDMAIAQQKAQLELEKAQIKSLQELEQTRNAITLEQARLDAELRIQEAQARADLSIQAMKAELDTAIKRQRQVVNLPELGQMPESVQVTRVVRQAPPMATMPEQEEPNEPAEGSPNDLREDKLEGED